MSNHQFYSLTVQSITPETDKAVTVAFDVPQDLQSNFQYKAGQYLTLKLDVNGQEARRSYSMCSSPIEETLAVTVKEVQNGLVSTYLNRQLKVGDTIEVMPPDGRFLVKPDAATGKSYYLFGAGSGITPLMSMIKTILEEEPKSHVFLLYGNRNEDSIIFDESLKQLAQKYKGQLTIEHILSQPNRAKSKGLSGLFSKGKITWTGKVGRIDASGIKEFLAKNEKRHQTAVYYICGPGAMIESTKRTLENASNVDSNNIYVEYFTAPEEEGSAEVTGASGAVVTAHLNGETVQVAVPEDKTILDVLVKEGYDPPYSCTSGACSTCLAKVTKGKVKMDVYYAIDDDEVAEGFVLTCQAHPTTKEVELTFDV
ncbi:MAG: ferredoxin--NADP reductase [Bacteroidota bacterium]